MQRSIIARSKTSAGSLLDMISGRYLLSFAVLMSPSGHFGRRYRLQGQVLSENTTMLQMRRELGLEIASDVEKADVQAMRPSQQSQ